jgi:hypothetical protein
MSTARSGGREGGREGKDECGYRGIKEKQAGRRKHLQV